MKPKVKAEIGILGGSGFYEFFEKAEKIKLKTPYGEPSAEITIAEIYGKKIAFLPRHGKKHEFPPHKVPYKANIYALKKLGVNTVISPCAAGSLSEKIKPGDFVILDQFVDRTKGRDDTFFNGPETFHIAGVEPYCPFLQKIAIHSSKKLKIKSSPKGTMVVINGPRFSTGAESLYFARQGFETVGMTQYPEVVLAREMEICFLGIALITDWDAGLTIKGRIKTVESKEVIKVFNQNIDKIKKLILEIIKSLPDKRACSCQKALDNARI